MDAEQLSRIEKHLWPKGFARDIWMLVDAARDQRIYGMLLDCFYSRHTCLFSGSLPPELQVIAPYLVDLEYDDPKTRRFICSAWGNRWGIFLQYDGRVEILRRHLRTFLTVRDEQGRRLMFRYYDPRVLRVYLPTCTPAELETVFGPVERFFVEERISNALLEFRVDQRHLFTTRRSLTTRNSGIRQ